MNNTSIFGNIISLLFGIIVSLIGFINIFWGNDSLFGVFLVLFSLVYVPQVNSIIKEKMSFSIPLLVKILLGVFIMVAALGVGELFDKIDLMMMDL